MGDMLTLIEKAEEVYEKDEAEVAAQRLLEGTFTLDDFLDQMQAIKKMGPLSSLMAMMPGVPKEVRDVDIDDKQIDRVEAIIRSMTREERTRPEIVDASRRGRIATGSGTSPNEVSQLIKQFREMSKMMKRMGGMGSKKMKKKKGKKGSGGGRVTQGRAPLRLPNLDPAGLPGMPSLPGLPAGGAADPKLPGLPGLN